MSIARHHSEWLSLVEQSGPFLSMPVLLRVFPQGLEGHDPETFRLLRVAYDEWEDNNQAGRRINPAIHLNWIRFVLKAILQLPDNCIAEGQAIPQTLQVNVAEHGELLRPNIIIKNPDGGPNGGKPRLLIQIYPAGQDLSKPVHGCTWKASPDTRMMELLHGTGVRLGLVTNGEQWMIVDAPRNETTGYASWYAHLWLEEQITLRAFTSLLNANRFFAVPDADTLEGMLAESASNQQEVTDQLGYQVRKAVEVLVESLDRADQDRSRQLLSGIPETELYEAALTVMMRLVFLFCAEERGLLLLGDDIYDENYAVSTTQEQLHETADQYGEQILETRVDAWYRLLSTFRGVFGGIQHERLTLPPYGGKLFDPDRFPFLEGRKHGTTWKTCDAEPLPVNNRTVLHLLDALQLLQVKLPGGGPAEARRLSFRALDIEQIGHVYEGLLDHTAKRATEPVLGLAGSKDGEMEITVSALEQLATKGEEAFIEFLQEQTGRSANALKKALHLSPSPGTLAFGSEAQARRGEGRGEGLSRFEAACGSGDDGKKLFARIQPFVGLLRDNTFGYPVVIRTGSVYVTAGTDRRSSGTHYTPKSLTEPIVQYTLEPLVYVGPAEGKPKEQWKLRSAKELLDLKICDMACGSGAFLVQACRYMSERLLEAWEIAEKTLPKGIPGITPEGTASTGQPGEMILANDPDERRAFARRIVAQRCLYGVDINPLAAEMAKLSLWLLTLAKDKPFTFLDHAIRCGDSLLGIHDLKQLKTFSLDGTGQQYVFGEVPMDELVDKAIELRLKIESMAGNTVEEVEAQARLMAECEQRVEFLKCAADMLIAAELMGTNPREKLAKRDDAAIQIGHYLKDGKPGEFRAAATKELRRRSFHWPLEFPEILVTRGGFDGFVGNPPFMGGKKITTNLSTPYRSYLLAILAGGTKGNADLCAYFLLQANNLLRHSGQFGFVATNSIAQGDTRLVGLDRLVEAGCLLTRAIPTRSWPGVASLEIALLWVCKGVWSGLFRLQEQVVDGISPFLTETGPIAGKPFQLSANEGKVFIGTVVYGEGFVLSSEVANQLLSKDKSNREVLSPYLNGESLYSSPTQTFTRWVINFGQRTLDEARHYPDCLSILERLVKPFRETVSEAQMRRNWWLHQRSRPALYSSIKHNERVLVKAQVSKTWAWEFVPNGWIYDSKLIVAVFQGWDVFALMQSTIHWEWSIQYGTTLRLDMSYTPTTNFVTFPFPQQMRSLANSGETYHCHRRSVLLSRNDGLTAAYNRFHDPDEASKDIQKFRDLHVEMDRAVAAAYGWDDLKLDHGFHQTKQGFRFTISESARREVLARLLKLNHERYAEEVAKGLHDKKKTAKQPRRELKADPGPNPKLFDYT